MPHGPQEVPASAWCGLATESGHAAAAPDSSGQRSSQEKRVSKIVADNPFDLTWAPLCPQQRPRHREGRGGEGAAAHGRTGTERARPLLQQLLGRRPRAGLVAPLPPVPSGRHNVPEWLARFKTDNKNVICKNLTVHVGQKEIAPVGVTGLSGPRGV